MTELEKIIKKLSKKDMKSYISTKIRQNTKELNYFKDVDNIQAPRCAIDVLAYELVKEFLGVKE